jgi:HAD superfamily hydrolase (TIGR01509 family)
MSPVPWQLVIFDNDGVIVDSEPLASLAMAETLTALGLPTTPADCDRTLKGRTLASTRTIVEAGSGRALPADFESSYTTRLFALMTEQLRPVPGVEAVLDLLDATRVPYCLASSGLRERIAFALKTAGLAERFGDRWWGSEDVAHGKPAPDLFLLAARSMGFAPSACVVVEDAEVGVEAARAAGMAVLGFAARTPAESLALADHIFTDMADLPALLLEGRG